MINRTVELMMNRRSVRTWADRIISEEDRQSLFDCAMRAATAGNMMLYSMIEITDQKLKDELSVSCDNQPFIAKAPLVVVFLADYQRMFDFYLASGADRWAADNGRSFRTPEAGDFMLAVNDALIAAQSMVTAAESLGIGSCYIGDIMENYEQHRDMLNLPEYAFPVTMVCFGYPKGEGPRTPIPRFEEKFIRFENGYKRHAEDDLLHLYDRLEAWQYKGKPHTYQEGNAGCYQYQRKYDSTFMKEMNRSVRAALENWKEK